jgi:hypothetical protein
MSGAKNKRKNTHIPHAHAHTRKTYQAQSMQTDENGGVAKTCGGSSGGKRQRKKKKNKLHANVQAIYEGNVFVAIAVIAVAVILSRVILPQEYLPKTSVSTHHQS